MEIAVIEKSLLFAFTFINIGIWNADELALTEQHIYGSSRLGLQQPNIVFENPNDVSEAPTTIWVWRLFAHR